MKLLTLDIAKCTGWCIYQRTPVRSVNCGSFRAEGDHLHRISAAFGVWLEELVRREADTGDPIKIVAIERLIGNNPVKKMKDAFGDTITVGASNASTMSWQSGQHGVAAYILLPKGIPILTASSQEWRAAFLPGMRPPEDRNTPAKRRTWWKNAAKAKAAEIGVKVPDDNAADALGMAFWLFGHLQHTRNQPQFMRDAGLRL